MRPFYTLRSSQKSNQVYSFHRPSASHIAVQEAPGIAHQQQSNRTKWLGLRLWLKQRPALGSLLLLLAGLFVLWEPFNFRQYVFIPGSTLWAGFLVGGLIFLMGLVQLFQPSYSLLTGALAIIFALVSLFVALGGFGVGLILGLVGGAYAVAWKSIPMSRAAAQRLLLAKQKRGKQKQFRLGKQSLASALTNGSSSALQNGSLAVQQGNGQVGTAQDSIAVGRITPHIFWFTLSASLVVFAGLLSLIPSGALALAVNLPTPFTITADKLIVRNSRLIIGRSRAFGIPAAITFGDIEAHNIRITKEVELPIVGRVVLTLTAGKDAPAFLNGSRTDITALHAGNAQITNQVATIQADNGFQITADEEVFTNVTIKAPFASADSATLPGLTLTVTRE
ncbi:MAG: hypothetical protein J2P36_29495 [Ktedonobacteraceae bacterium]|nr:hypothetical protein [Ktedonobacteraceae bacterium]